jgi:hypothetical protein
MGYLNLIYPIALAICPNFHGFLKILFGFLGGWGGGAVATMFFTLDRYTVRAKQLIPYCVIA